MGAIVWVFLVLAISAGASAETIKLAGSGGMIPLVTELAKAYMAKNPDDTVEVEQKSIEAKGGIMGAYNGAIDVGMSARLLEPDETALGLQAAEIARVATVVAVNAESVKLTSIKSDDVCGIYAGRITNWKELGGADMRIRAFTRPEPDATKLSVRKGIRCFSALSEAPGVVIMPKSSDMNGALINNAGAIGFSDNVAVNKSGGKMRALAVDGVQPTDDNVAAGKWKVIKNFVLVTKGAPKGLAKRFIDFVKSPEGRSIIEKNEAVPVR